MYGRYFIMVLVILGSIFSSIAYFPYVNAISFKNDYMLYIYGSKTCPHCHSLANYLIDNEMVFTWFWIEDEENFNYLKRIASDFDLTRGTPTVIVYSSGKPVAIVVGAVLNDDFWRRIIDNPSNVLKIYLGESLIKEVQIPQDFQEKYIAIHTASYDEVKAFAKGAEPIDIVNYIPTIIILMILVGMVIVVMKGRR